MRQCRRFVVTGRVQGVFFRASTQDTARHLGLTGWVRNLPNGDVEVLACGTPTALDQFQTWLWQGPPSATVGNVAVFECAAEEFAGFRIVR
jgi:acylphosphatase